ncbi:hypothetical protein [Pedobacter sp. JY14-1]|uniref:hypothetical protein n=1 Tax=Pedobacter sp. JY14-1 TaxID=3034151 RepID=UPI0023E297F6|nr:hypothetical protein [Pedobacter sp. JY14-1]
MKPNSILQYAALIFTFLFPAICPAQKKSADKEPRIVNIVNFIRDIEPREAHVTKDVLYQTVVKQIDLMNKYQLGGTFLLQYDALIDPRYQELLKTLDKSKFEIGAWWELPQQLIEKAGIKWRGKYSWDWHSDIGFSVGYTPQEREKIIDTYFADFRNIFGHYPKSVASWVIDGHSLAYMYDKYKIVASANCKDQVGTDGFTLWGGYWNQAYYPSRINAYMPAQKAGKQLPVPVFRMLGSDPVRQYADGRSVITLEPVYPKAGGNEQWINWFLQSFSSDPALGFNYTQAGQENSFTWENMHKGLEIQMPIIAKLRQEAKVRVETMSESGEWFKKTYKVTPATSFTVTKDLGDSDAQTIWYNSRYYRINLFWKNGNMTIRDIHFFNETIPDKYMKAVTTINQSFFYTLPVVDGFNWGTTANTAGLKLMTSADGTDKPLNGGKATFKNSGKDKVEISWPTGNGNFSIILREKMMTIVGKGQQNSNWFLDLNVEANAKTTVNNIENNQVNYLFDGHSYQLNVTKGSLEKPANGAIYRIKPEGQKLILKMSDQ